MLPQKDPTFNHEVILAKNHQEASKKACTYISTKIIDILSKQKECSLMLCGGSTPKDLYRMLSQSEMIKSKWKDIHIYFSDERMVPPNSKRSNYYLVKKNLLKNICIPKENVFRILGESKSNKAESSRYEKLLLSKLRKCNGIPSIDLCLLGIGADGHVASIFPNTKLRPLDLVSVAIDKNGENRITTTPGLINNSRFVCFLVTGDEKKSIISKAYSKTALPYHRINGLIETKIYTDQSKESLTGVCEPLQIG